MKQKLCKVTMIFSILVTTILFGISVSANDNITNIEDIKGHGTSYDKIYIDENYRGDAVYNTKYQYVDCKKEFVVAEGNSKTINKKRLYECGKKQKTKATEISGGT